MPHYNRTQLICTRCKEPLGETDGRQLYIGHVRFLRTITFRCLCGQRREWSPAPLDLVGTLCYVEQVPV